ncbi:hypothetical protein [Kitasatospora sp. NPDC058046]|uniref:hypothetical protein n=1 Tax=Kitasatospora sp. NPDC058046 TaxID=3346312 RepID=UPI0036DC3CDA
MIVDGNGFDGMVVSPDGTVGITDGQAHSPSVAEFLADSGDVIAALFGGLFTEESGLPE